MKRKFLGWSVIVLISLVPVLLLLFFGPSYGFSYSDITHRLGQIAGLVGLTLFAITFVLSTRAKFLEETFGGLDKVYKTHCILGGSALALLVFHPILLVLKFIPKNIPLAANYLLPGTYWSVNFGIIALLGLVILLCVTFFLRIKYNYWKTSHKFLGLLFFAAVLHIFLIRNASRDFIFHGYYVYIVIISLIGLCAFLYTLMFKKKKSLNYAIEKIEKKNQVYCLDLISNEKPLKYKSGQFIFVRFYSKNLGEEAHPFSIASKSNDKIIRICIKNLGDFTSRLNNLKVGDKVKLEGPYGKFGFSSGKNQIWIAGGIGVTPFLGMAQDLKDENVELYYVVKDEKDFIMLDELKAIEKAKRNFKVIEWLACKKGLITIEDIKKISGDFAGKEFYLCGPAGLKDSIRKGLLKYKVDERRIHDEEFNLK
jgi:predicted ferric reductase